MGKLGVVFSSVEQSKNEGLPSAPEIAGKPETRSIDVRRTGLAHRRQRGCGGAKVPLNMEGPGKKSGLAYLLVVCQTLLPEISHHPETHPGIDHESPWEECGRRDEGGGRREEGSKNVA